jgi:hypothetical protein
MHEDNIVYMMTNDLAPGYVKVGRTNDVKRRKRELNSLSSTVGNWNVHEFYESQNDIARLERAALCALHEYQVQGRREQFRLDPAKAWPLGSRLIVS